MKEQHPQDREHRTAASSLSAGTASWLLWFCNLHYHLRREHVVALNRPKSPPTGLRVEGRDLRAAAVKPAPALASCVQGNERPGIEGEMTDQQCEARIDRLKAAIHGWALGRRIWREASFTDAISFLEEAPTSEPINLVMTFEGELYGILNGEHSESLRDEFEAVIEKEGFWWESWDHTAAVFYATSAEDAQVLASTGSGNGCVVLCRGITLTSTRSYFNSFRRTRTE